MTNIDKCVMDKCKKHVLTTEKHFQKFLEKMTKLKVKLDKKQITMEQFISDATKYKEELKSKKSVIATKECIKNKFSKKEQLNVEKPSMNKKSKSK